MATTQRRPGVISQLVVKELWVWGPDGPFGGLPPKLATPKAKGLASMLGVNAIWGFGTNGYSENSEPGNGVRGKFCLPFLF